MRKSTLMGTAYSAVEALRESVCETFFSKPPTTEIKVPEAFSIPQYACFWNAEKKAERERRLKKQAQNKLDINFRTYNLAILGQLGTGKSSLINAARQVNGGDGYACVDELQSFESVVKYRFSDEHPHIYLWDMPSVNSFAHPKDSYFEDNFLYLFDFLVILFEDRLTDFDLQLARMAKRHGVGFAFVRSKSDLAIQQLVLQKPEEMLRAVALEEAVAELRRSVIEQEVSRLQDAGFVNAEIYFISSRAIEDCETRQMDEMRLIFHIIHLVFRKRNPRHT